jgi:hypothetical protein
MTTARGTVWLSESLLGVYRVSARTSRLVARIPVGPAGSGFVAVQLISSGKRQLAVRECTSDGTLPHRNALARLDVTRNRVEPLTPLPRGELTTAYGEGSLWVGVVDGSSVTAPSNASR